MAGPAAGGQAAVRASQALGGAELRKLKQAQNVAATKKDVTKATWFTIKWVLGLGGAFGSILVALLVLYFNPDSSLTAVPINDRGLLRSVGRNAKGWTAGAAPVFDGWTLDDARRLEGVGLSPMAGSLQPCSSPEIPFPANFDARARWPGCFRTPVYAMGNCTASWAIASASSLSDRFCLADPERHGNLRLSPQQLLSCDDVNHGCGGGNLDSVWRYVQRVGLVSEACFPYKASDRLDCEQRCWTEEPLKSAGHCLVRGADAIKREIFLSGPIVAPLFLMNEFFVYKDGVFQETGMAQPLMDSRRQRIIHAVKILGWGAEAGKDYWLIENSWGDGWGDRGFAKVLLSGVLEDEAEAQQQTGIVVESFAIAATPASSKLIGKAEPDRSEDEPMDLDLEFDDLDELDELGS